LSIFLLKFNEYKSRKDVISFSNNNIIIPYPKIILYYILNIIRYNFNINIDNIFLNINQYILNNQKIYLNSEFKSILGNIFYKDYHSINLTNDLLIFQMIKIKRGNLLNCYVYDNYNDKDSIYKLCNIFNNCNIIKVYIYSQFGDDLYYINEKYNIFFMNFNTYYKMCVKNNIFIIAYMKINDISIFKNYKISYGSLNRTHELNIYEILFINNISKFIDYINIEDINYYNKILIKNNILKKNNNKL
jgi:hypothetical protein